MEISEKKVVIMHYKGTLEDGSVFDTSEGRDPLEFMYGVGMLIPGLEKELVGLKAGDKKTVKVSSDEAYGPKNDQAIQEVPKDQFPQDVELKPGAQLMAQGPQGPIMLTVVEVKEEVVIVDFNHPLAGKDLTFEVEIVEVREPTEQELAHGHAHPGGEDQDHGEESLEEKVDTEPSEEDSKKE